MMDRFETMLRLYRRTATLLVMSVAVALPTFGQSGSISGSVTDATDSLPLAGANVLIFGENGVMVTGAASGEDGTYRIVAVPAGSYALQARFLGYQAYETDVVVAGGQNLAVDISLSATGFELNTVVITGSRREEKVLEAPASMSVLTSEDVARAVGNSSIEALRNTTGVDMAQTGIDRREVVLRGFNNAFSGASYVLTDYRHAAVASLAVNIYSIMPNMSIDVDRVEVVRGPGSALYGAGVDSGVIHFLSKDPFSHPGTTVSLSGGERNLMGVQFRHAGVLGEKQNIGYKITGMYSQADDWKMDKNDPVDAVQLEGDVVPRNTDYSKDGLNGTLEYRFSDRGSVIANAGYASLDATVLSGIGTLQAINFGYAYGQVRFQYDRFFAQAYLNKNRAGDSFVYDQATDTPGEAKPVVDNGVMYNVQAQYDADLGPRQNIIAGVDLELTRPDTDGTILGRNEDSDEITEYGAYVQSLTRITPKLDLTLALRGDYNNVVDKFQLSPRAAVVVKPVDGHSFRVTYNRAFSSPSTNSNFLDIIAATDPLVVRGRGSAHGFTWERDEAGNLLATSLLPNRLGQTSAIGAELDAIYELVYYQGLTEMDPAVIAGLLQQQGIAIDAQGVAGLVSLLSPTFTTVSGLSQGILALPNLTTGATDLNVAPPVDVKPLAQTITQTVEVGYKGLFKNRLLVTVDAYYTRKEDFVGPLILESPLVVTPNLARDLTTALAAGIAGNATLNGALGQLGLTPAQVAAIVVGFAEDDLPDAVGIVQAVENDPGVGVAPELMLTYRNFGNLSYTGVDLGFEFMASDRLSIFGNASWVSDDFFDENELDEAGTGLELALNATAFKGRLGLSYESNMGLSVSVAGRYTDSFPILSGPYVGVLPSYTLVDLNIGYDLGETVPGLRLDLGISNLLSWRADTNDPSWTGDPAALEGGMGYHREFIGSPLMGRLGMLRATYTF